MFENIFIELPLFSKGLVLYLELGTKSFTFRKKFQISFFICGQYIHPYFSPFVC